MAVKIEDSIVEDALARVLMRAYIDACTADGARDDGLTTCVDKIARDEEILRDALFTDNDRIDK